MKPISLSLTFALLAAFLIPAGEARAATVFTAILGGVSEVPPTATSASGSVTVTVHDDWFPPSIYLDLQASFSGLSSGWTIAGLYGPAAPGQTGPLIFDIASIFGLTPPPGATAGDFGVMDKSISPEILDALHAGLVYFNLHSSAFPNGEIRGQLLLVPEPSVLPLFLIGAALLISVRRRSQPDASKCFVRILHHAGSRK